MISRKDKIMKLKYKFITKNVAGSLVALTPGMEKERFNGMIKLNEVGAFILDKLSVETTEEDIVTKLLEEYEVDRPTAEKSVSDFVSKLREGGLLEE